MTSRTEHAEPGAAPTRYGLRFPDTWWHLDLDPNTRDASIRRRLEEGLAGPDTDPERLDTLIRMARRSAREAHDRGALQLAGVFEVLDNDSTLTATTMVLRVPLPEGESSDLASLLLPVAMRNSRNPLLRDMPGSRAEIVEHPQVGAVGRVTSLEDVDYYGQATIRTALLQTLIPVPDSDTVLVIASQTPNVGLMEPFFEVFDAIARTFRFAA
ncbi:hypothetical protein PJ985_05960 [Streptomyces sp. ACA25]|uniref:hypothetical protein n=1 Tax=Streptomyces sp. ACA25 TaxID=3022596 RepID=UPI002307ECCD|nr:hypothetical protein [Streptomyces sp. ACA25]MDB1087111.1 hypothetical protein [Streptomyces sp. ACA25]